MQTCQTSAVLTCYGGRGGASDDPDNDDDDSQVCVVLGVVHTPPLMDPVLVGSVLG